jgi:hypothetical protein
MMKLRRVSEQLRSWDDNFERPSREGYVGLSGNGYFMLIYRYGIPYHVSETSALRVGRPDSQPHSWLLSLITLFSDPRGRLVACVTNGDLTLL